MATFLVLDTVGGANLEGYALRNVGSLHVGGGTLADAALGVLQITGNMYVSGNYRKPNNTYSQGRNAGNTAWVDEWKINTANQLESPAPVNLTSTLSVTGAATFSDHVAVGDGKNLAWGAVGDTAFVGNSASDKIEIYTGAALRGQFTGGIFAWGTTVTTGAAAGDVVLANGKALRGVNAGGTGTFALIGSDGNNAVSVGHTAGAVGIGGVNASIGGSGDHGSLILGNGKALRSIDPAGTVTRPLISLSSADRLVLGGSDVIAIIHHYAAPIPAEAINNGAIIVDSATPGQLVFYANGARYKLTGTAF